MDQTMPYVLALVLAATVVMAALARMITRPRARAHDGPSDSRMAISTEGMKVCPRCRMGNMWSERTCSACGSRLRG